MNQGKLKVVKQKMARVNIDILGISELKWTGMGEYNSEDHCIYYCGQNSLRRNGTALIVKKRVQNVVLGCNLKNNRMISVHFQGKAFNITVVVMVVVSSLSCVQLLRSYQDPLSWDSPGKNTGVGCHFLLQGIFPILESNWDSCIPGRRYTN